MTWRSDTGRVRVNVDSLRLEPGAHRSPRDGVCLLELASVLAEEEFSDRPRCVCVVLAAFLRGWNDRSGHAERQQLRPYAERVIGSRARRSVTHLRRDICLIWAGADLSGNWMSRAMRRLAMRLRILAIAGVRPALRLNEGAGELASRIVFSRYGSRAGLRLIDTLLAVGSGVELTPGVSGGDEGDALARAIVESAVRNPVPPATTNGAGPSGNGGNGHTNGADRRAESAGRVTAGT